jgi:PPM family protein phosphatase
MSMMTPRDVPWPSAPLGTGGTSSAMPARDGANTRHAEISTRWTHLEAAVATSAGGRHAVNEDCHSALDGAMRLFVVADGVGGGALASRASRELVSRLHAALEGGGAHPDSVRAALLDADRAIRRSIACDSERSGAATVALCKATGVALSQWLVAWVGDCRVYRLPVGREVPAQLLTVDDTYRHLHEEPPSGGSLDDPARMVGNGAIDAPNVRRVVLRSDEMLVLCSDGLHRHAGPFDLARVLRGPGSLASRCLKLIECARASGSRDDATVLVVHRARRDGVRLARIVTVVGLAMLIAVGLLWLGSDQATGQASQRSISQRGAEP